MIANIANLARWEWFKLRQHWMIWALLVLLVLTGLLNIWVAFQGYQQVQRTGGEVLPPISMVRQDRPPEPFACRDLLSGDPARQPSGIDPETLALMRTQCGPLMAQLPERLRGFYDDFALPGSLPHALELVQPLGLILLAIVTAWSIGIDYGSGALRTVLARGTGRRTYLLAKMLTLSVVAAIALLITAVAVAIGSLAAGATVAAMPSLGAVGPTWSAAGLALGKAWVSFLPYLAATILVTVVFRASAAGIALGIGYYVGEQVVVPLLSGLISWLPSFASSYLLVGTISAWTSAGPATPGAVDATHAFVVLCCYFGVCTAFAMHVYSRSDVRGATGAG